MDHVGQCQADKDHMHVSTKIQHKISVTLVAADKRDAMNQHDIHIHVEVPDDVMT